MLSRRRSDQAPPAALREVWLVVDGSGSMGGRPEEQARDAALFFVKDLPHGQSARPIPHTASAFQPCLKRTVSHNGNASG